MSMRFSLLTGWSFLRLPCGRLWHWSQTTVARSAESFRGLTMVEDFFFFGAGFPSDSGT